MDRVSPDGIHTHGMEGAHMVSRLISRKSIILCITVILLTSSSASYAGDGLVGKWRPIDSKTTISGFRFIPELKFAKDGTLYADGTYGYRIIDDSKFVWELGNGIERVYKYEVTGDRLMIYSLTAPDDRARFKRVR